MSFIWGAVAYWLRCCATNRKVAGSIPASVNGFSIDIKSFRSHYGPGVDSASNKWVPGTFPGGKGGRCVGLTALPPSCAVVIKNLGTLTSWNPLGHSRPVMGLLYLYLVAVHCDVTPCRWVAKGVSTFGRIVGPFTWRVKWSTKKTFFWDLLTFAGDGRMFVQNVGQCSSNGLFRVGWICTYPHTLFIWGKFFTII